MKFLGDIILWYSLFSDMLYANEGYQKGKISKYIWIFYQTVCHHIIKYGSTIHMAGSIWFAVIENCTLSLWEGLSVNTVLTGLHCSVCICICQSLQNLLFFIPDKFSVLPPVASPCCVCCPVFNALYLYLRDVLLS